MLILSQTDCIINHISYKDGDYVQQGAEILIYELMKMSIPLNAPISGTIIYKVKLYDYALNGQPLADISYQE